MNRTPITSSLIKSIGYEDGEVHVEFHHGGIYRYTGPKVKEHFDGMMSASSQGLSVGKHFLANLKKCPLSLCCKI